MTTVTPRENLSIAESALAAQRLAVEAYERELEAALHYWPRYHAQSKLNTALAVLTTLEARAQEARRAVEE